MEQTAALLRLQEFKQILLTFKMLFIFAERYFRRKRIKGKKKNTISSTIGEETDTAWSGEM